MNPGLLVPPLTFLYQSLGSCNIGEFKGWVFFSEWSSESVLSVGRWSEKQPRAVGSAAKPCPDVAGSFEMALAATAMWWVKGARCQAPSPGWLVSNPSLLYGICERSQLLSGAWVSVTLGLIFSENAESLTVT